MNIVQDFKEFYEQPLEVSPQKGSILVQQPVNSNNNFVQVSPCEFIVVTADCDSLGS